MWIMSTVPPCGSSKLDRYETVLRKLADNYTSSRKKVETPIAAYQPEQGVKVLIERYRAVLYIVLGIDLRRWANSASWVAYPAGREEELPPVLLALLGAPEEVYGRLPNDSGVSINLVYP